MSVAARMHSLMERKSNQIDAAWIKGIRKSWKVVVGQAKKHKFKTMKMPARVHAKPPNRRTIIAYLWKYAGRDMRSGKGEERQVMWGPGISTRLGDSHTYTYLTFKEKTDKELLDIANLLGMAEKRTPKEQRAAEITLYKHIIDECARATAALENVKRYLDRLRTDLLINKSMWVQLPFMPGKTSGKKGSMEAIRTKVVVELDAADEVLNASQSRIRYWKGATHVRKQGMQGERRADAYEMGQQGYDAVLKTIALQAVEGATGADAIISRKLFGHLTRVTKKAGGTLDWEGHEPSKISLGKMDIIFQDTPLKGRGMHKGIQGDYPERQGRSPFNRKAYIKHLKHVQALFRKRGLSFLWKGTVLIQPQTDRVNQLDPNSGVGGTYTRQGDFIKVYSNPGPFIVELIAHEIGHRYYYKYMTRADQHHFDKWFGKVKAVSTYGGRHTKEDFAEIFAHYIQGKHLTRDQIDRFKSVLGKTRRVESVRALVNELRG